MAATPRGVVRGQRERKRIRFALPGRLFDQQQRLTRDRPLWSFDERRRPRPISMPVAPGIVA